MATPAEQIIGALRPGVSNAQPTVPKPKGNPPSTIVAKGGSKPVPKKAPPAKKPAAKKPAPKKKPSATAKYLAGDTTYQRQLADYNKSKADYEANYKRQTGIINRDYAESQRSLNRQGAQDRLDQQNDFAGRGILHSGVFAKALGDYNTDFNARMKQLTTGRGDQVNDLSFQRKSFLDQLRIEMNNAREDALRRRAAQLGI
jgi:hypothetical protein